MFLDGIMHGVGCEIKLAGPFDEPLFAVDLLEELWIFQCFEDPIQVRFPKLNLPTQAIGKSYRQAQLTQWLHMNDLIEHVAPHSNGQIDCGEWYGR
jgi:hypothetical protein